MKQTGDKQQLSDWIKDNLHDFSQQGYIQQNRLETIPLKSIIGENSAYSEALTKMKVQGRESDLQSYSLQYVKWDLQLGTALMFLANTCSVLLCILLYYIFMNISVKQYASFNNYILVVAAIIVKIARSILGLIAENRLKQIGMKLFRCISQAVVDKTFEVSLSSSQEILTISNLSKLIHLDLEKILSYPYKVAYVRVNIVTALLNLGAIFFLLGWVGFIACLIYFVLFMGNLVHKWKADDLEIELMKSRDIRIKSTMELMSIIKFIKVNALQKYFYHKILSLRQKQMSVFHGIFRLQMFSVFHNMGFSKIYLPTIIFCLALLHYQVDTAIYNCLYILFFTVFFFKLSKEITSTKEAQICIANIAQLLLIKSNDKSYISHEIYKTPKANESTISVEGSFYWQNLKAKTQQNNQQIFKLSNIQLNVEKGSLAALTGVYGCGKTSVLECIFGEMKAQEGARVKIYGKVGYVSQKPWIMNETVRNNILFGETFNEEKYKRAIYYSGLEKDLMILHKGDRTLIGQRGCTISGGQKVRIAFARALYSDADIFLLDDIFSAMDAHVSSFLFQKTLKELLKGKTILLITHNMQFAKQSDQLYSISNGKLCRQPTQKQSPKASSYYNYLNINIDKVSQQSQSQQQPYDKKIQQGLLLYQERNGETSFIIMTLITLGFLLMLILGYHQWNNYWTVANDKEQPKYIMISYCFCLLCGAVVIVFGYILYNGPIYKTLHRDMLRALLHAPIEYFEITSSAQITSRISSDLMICDKVLGNQYYFLHANIGSMLGQLATFAFLNYRLHNVHLFIILVLYVISLGYFYVKYFFSTVYFYNLKEQNRTVLNFRYEQTLDGLATIRSFGKQQQEKQQFMKKVDRYLKTTLVYDTLESYLSFNIAINSSLYFTFILILHFFIDYTDIYSNMLIASVIINEESLNRINTSLTEFLVKLKSLLKCEEICKIQKEQQIEELQQLGQNPFIEQDEKHLFSEGKIVFKNVSLRYNENSPNAVNRLSFTIGSQQKIGVVGRTGSGKSTLLLSLLKMVGVSEGIIEIDGMNLTTVPSNLVRKQINTIMQDHFLFSGTVRDNVDPASEHTDQQVRTVLKEVGLWAKLQLRDGLSFEVMENGKNLSAGERQLLNISRALLKPKALVLVDQATASIDSQTDAKIQEIMKKKFQNSTVFTIAHRISTILESDRIMVVHCGQIAEFDTPSKLLSNQNSLFFSLYQQFSQNNQQKRQQY